MFSFYKGEPNIHTILFRDGEFVKEGAGLNFWYMPSFSTIVAVPAASTDAPFIFTEATKDYQELAVQGTLTYRIINPAAIAKLLDFSVEPRSGLYLSEDPEKVINRVVTAIQGITRAKIAGLSLRDAFRSTKNVTEFVLENIAEDADLANLGVQVDSLHITSMRATPEIQKALEADYREQLQREADQAIYARRAAAVEEERTIKERELGTEVELENQRKELVDTQARNQLAKAEAEAKADEMKLNPYANMPPQALIGIALKDWAQYGGSVGNLSISPDILSGLVGWLNSANNQQVEG